MSPQKLGIDILIPTRERPNSVEQVLQSISKSAYEPKDICVFFYLDSDDRASLDRIDHWKDWLEKMPLGKVTFVGGPRTNLAAAYNHLATYTAGDIFMYAADDISFNTPGWDEVIRDFFLKSVDRTWLVWADDPAREDGFPDHGFMSRWAKNCLRYIFPVFPPHPDVPDAKGIAFTDIWLKAVYEQLGRLKQLKEIEIAHNHWTQGTPFDDNYVRHAIIQKFHATAEYGARINEIPKHVGHLRNFINWWEGTKKQELPKWLAREMDPVMPEGWFESWKAGRYTK